MWKRRKALLWTLVGLLIVFAVVLVSTPPRQPVYKGLTLVQWLDVVERHRVNFTTSNGRPTPGRDATPDEIKDAEDAVRAIGTNAFPFLLRWTGYKPSPAKRLFRGILEVTIDKTHVHWFVTDAAIGLAYRREFLAELGVQGFRILHTNAFALETLSKLAADTNNPLMQEPAAKALTTVSNTPGL